MVVSLKISPQLQSFFIKHYSGKCFVWAVFLLGFWSIELMSHCSSFPSLFSQASWKGALNSPLFSIYPSTHYDLASAAHESTKLIFPVGIFNITYDLALPSSSITHHLPWDHVLHPANDPRVVFGLLQSSLHLKCPSLLQVSSEPLVIMQVSTQEALPSGSPSLTHPTLARIKVV